MGPFGGARCCRYRDGLHHDQRGDGFHAGTTVAAATKPPPPKGIAVTVAQLYNVPRTSAEISIWSFANRDSHNLIVQALQTKKNTTGLLTFVLDPLPTVDYSNFLLRHQLMHNQMDAVLHIG